MGGCASKPKDLDVNEVAPAPVEAPVVENVEPETVAQVCTTVRAVLFIFEPIVKDKKP